MSNSAAFFSPFLFSVSHQQRSKTFVQGLLIYANYYVYFKIVVMIILHFINSNFTHVMQSEFYK